MGTQLIYAIMYLEINVVAVVLVAIIRYKTSGLTKMVAQRNFAMSIDAEIAFFLSDTFYVMMKCGIISYTKWGVIISKEIYFFSTALVCYFWFLYFEHMQDSPFVKKRRNVRLSSILVWIMGVFLIINLFTGILFYVDEDGLYRRGTLFVVQYLLSYIYVFFTCFRALIGAFQKEKISNRKMLICLALFPVFPAGAGILQFIYPELPLACAALSIATLLMYLQWIDQIISIDPLTRLNNRKQLDYHYNQWKNSLLNNDKLFLVIIDANRFKSINDNFGHIEGDAALVRIADALRLSCRGYHKRTNIARYGGDEFVILAWADDEKEIMGLMKSIDSNLLLLNNKADVPYELTVCCGYAKAENNQSLNDLIKIADDVLYKNKNTR